MVLQIEVTVMTTLVVRYTIVSHSTYSVKVLGRRLLINLAAIATSGKYTVSTNEDPLGPTSHNQTRFLTRQCINSRPNRTGLSSAKAEARDAGI